MPIKSRQGHSPPNGLKLLEVGSVEIVIYDSLECLRTSSVGILRTKCVNTTSGNVSFAKPISETIDLSSDDRLYFFALCK